MPPVPPGGQATTTAAAAAGDVAGWMYAVIALLLVLNLAAIGGLGYVGWFFIRPIVLKRGGSGATKTASKHKNKKGQGGGAGGVPQRNQVSQKKSMVSRLWNSEPSPEETTDLSNPDPESRMGTNKTPLMSTQMPMRCGPQPTAVAGVDPGVRSQQMDPDELSTPLRTTMGALPADSGPATPRKTHSAEAGAKTPAKTPSQATADGPAAAKKSPAVADKTLSMTQPTEMRPLPSSKGPGSAKNTESAKTQLVSNRPTLDGVIQSVSIVR